MRTYPLRETITHDAREYSVTRVRGAFFTHALVIRQGSHVKAGADVYAVEEEAERPEGAPRSFIVCKCGRTQEGLYLVTLGDKPSCQCYGFNRWGACKHLDALSDLVKRNGI